MAAGVPVIVSEIGGMREIVKNGFTGLKVSPGNVDALAKNILRILCEQDLAKVLKTNSLSIVKNQYSWEKIAENTRALYSEVLAEYEKSPWGESEEPSTNLSKAERRY